MNCWCGISNFAVRQSFNQLLSKNAFVLDNQSFLKCTRWFAFNAKRPTELSYGLRYVPSTVSRNCSKLPSLREFSSSKAFFSPKGSNRDKENKSIRIMTISIASVILLFVYLAMLIEEHQDIVVINPDEEK